MERTKSVLACSVLETFKGKQMRAKVILEALPLAWYKAELPFLELPAGDMVAGDQISPESTPKSENMSIGSKQQQDKNYQFSSQYKHNNDKNQWVTFRFQILDWKAGLSIK